jgi:phage-related protein
VGSAQRLAARQNCSRDLCVHEGRTVLLHGFIKKTQKTPADAMELALRRKREIT